MERYYSIDLETGSEFVVASRLLLRSLLLRPDNTHALLTSPSQDGMELDQLFMYPFSSTILATSALTNLRTDKNHQKERVIDDKRPIL